MGLTQGVSGAYVIYDTYSDGVINSSLHETANEGETLAEQGGYLYLYSYEPAINTVKDVIVAFKYSSTLLDLKVGDSFGASQIDFQGVKVGLGEAGACLIITNTAGKDNMIANTGTASTQGITIRGNCDSSSFTLSETNVVVYYNSTTRRVYYSSDQTTGDYDVSAYDGTKLWLVAVTSARSSNAGNKTGRIMIYDYKINEFGSGPPVVNHFSITAKDNETLANINTFNATIDGTTYFTTNGTINTGINSTAGLKNIIIRANQHFSRSYNNYNVSTNLQGVLLEYPIIRAYDDETGKAISIFNVTYSGVVYSSSASKVYFPFDTSKTVLFKSNGFNNQIVTHNFTNSNNLNQSLLFTLARMKFYVRELPNNVSVSEFYLNVSSYNSSYTNRIGTTNGTLNAALPRETLNISVDTSDLEYVWEDYFNPIYNIPFTFYVYGSNSLSLNLYYYSNSSVFSGKRVNITIDGPEYLENFTTTGFKYFEGLDSGHYQIDLVPAGDYSPVTNFFTVVSRTHQVLDVYFSSSLTCHPVQLNIFNNLNTLQDNVTVSFSKKIGGVWLIVAQKKSDISGTVTYCMDEILYKIIAQKDGYATWSGELTPYGDTYSIVLNPISSQTWTYTLGDIYIKMLPSINSFNINTTTPINFSLFVSSASGNLLYFGLNTTYNGTSYIENITGSPAGGLATIEIPLIMSEKNLKITYFLYTASNQPFSWDRYLSIYGFEISQYSLSEIFTDWRTESGDWVVLFWSYVGIVIILGLIALSGANMTIIMVASMLLISIMTSPIVGAIPYAIGIMSVAVLLLLTIAMNRGGQL